VASGLVTRPLRGLPPCGVKTKHGLRRGANLPARQEGDRQRAGRQTGAVDDDRFAADARRLEPLQIVDDRTTRIGDDPHGCAGGRNRNPGGNADKQHQAGVAHLPILSPIRRQHSCLCKGLRAPRSRALSMADLRPDDAPCACVERWERMGPNPSRRHAMHRLDHKRCTAPVRRSAAGIARLIHAPAAAAELPRLGNTGQGQHIVGTVKGRLTGRRERALLPQPRRPR
jgi:hypothetical protein